MPAYSLGWVMFLCSASHRVIESAFVLFAIFITACMGISFAKLAPLIALFVIIISMISLIALLYLLILSFRTKKSMDKIIEEIIDGLDDSNKIRKRWKEEREKSSYHLPFFLERIKRRINLK